MSLILCAQRGVSIFPSPCEGRRTLPVSVFSVACPVFHSIAQECRALVMSSSTQSGLCSDEYVGKEVQPLAIVSIHIWQLENIGFILLGNITAGKGKPGNSFSVL